MKQYWFSNGKKIIFYTTVFIFDTTYWSIPCLVNTRPYIWFCFYIFSSFSHPIRINYFNQIHCLREILHFQNWRGRGKMTLREMFPEWWCKFSLSFTDYCTQNYSNRWNWLDFTLGELFFTIFLLIGVPFTFLVLLTYAEDYHWNLTAPRR